jgi:hypothetical protein
VFSFKQQNCLTASRHYSHHLSLHTITNSLPKILSMWLNKSLLSSLKYFQTTATCTWNKPSCLRRKSLRLSCLLCIYISAIILICFLHGRQNIFSNSVNKIHINATECAHSSHWFILKSNILFSWNCLWQSQMYKFFFGSILLLTHTIHIQLTRYLSVL